MTHFNAERVPVSLGIVLDTSGSMDGDKMVAARQALDRFLFQLVDPNDEVFLYRFDNAPELVEGWTRDKRRISESLNRIQPRGSTSLYDAVADAVRLAQQGHNRKKAVVIISDGNDTSSRTDVFAVKQLIRETEVLVYAIGIDSARLGLSTSATSRPQRGPGSSAARPAAAADPDAVSDARRRRPPRVAAAARAAMPQPPPGAPVGGGSSRWRGGGGGSDDRVNVAALRDITDDSGGRTEIVRWARDLDPAVAGIADELSKQYLPGLRARRARRTGAGTRSGSRCASPSYHVRARRGYVAGK